MIEKGISLQQRRYSVIHGTFNQQSAEYFKFKNIVGKFVNYVTIQSINNYKKCIQNYIKNIVDI